MMKKEGRMKKNEEWRMKTGRKKEKIVIYNSSKSFRGMPRYF